MRGPAFSPNPTLEARRAYVEHTVYQRCSQALDQLPSSADQMFENVRARCRQPLRARAESGPGVFSPLLESGRNNEFPEPPGDFSAIAKRTFTSARRITSSLPRVSVRHRGARPPIPSGSGPWPTASRRLSDRAIPHWNRGSIDALKRRRVDWRDEESDSLLDARAWTRGYRAESDARRA